jgi:transcriptional repressor NrdR
MQCPYCQHIDHRVLESRIAEDSKSIRRRRQCAKCKKRFTTYERIEGVDLKVIKKDGKIEEFDREKIRRGLVKATWKRPVSSADINIILDEVEAKLRLKQATSVKSWEIGNMVLRRLKKLDPLGYLLFASVYRDFTDIADFQKEIETLLSDQPEATS